MLSTTPFSQAPSTLDQVLADLGGMDPLNNRLDPYSSLIEAAPDLGVADSKIARNDLQDNFDFLVDRVNSMLSLVTTGLAMAGGGSGTGDVGGGGTGVAGNVASWANATDITDSTLAVNEVMANAAGGGGWTTTNRLVTTVLGNTTMNEVPTTLNATGDFDNVRSVALAGGASGADGEIYSDGPNLMWFKGGLAYRCNSKSSGTGGDTLEDVVDAGDTLGSTQQITGGRVNIGTVTTSTAEGDMSAGKDPGNYQKFIEATAEFFVGTQEATPGNGYMVDGIHKYPPFDTTYIGIRGADTSSLAFPLIIQKTSTGVVTPGFAAGIAFSGQNSVGAGSDLGYLIFETADSLASQFEADFFMRLKIGDGGSAANVLRVRGDDSALIPYGTIEPFFDATHDVGTAGKRFRNGIFNDTLRAGSMFSGLNNSQAVQLGEAPTGAATGSGIKFANMTTAERNFLTVADGLQIYNTDTNTMQARVNGVWVDLGQAGGTILGAVGSDNTVPRADGGTNDTLQSSGMTIDDSGYVGGVTGLNVGDAGEAVNPGWLSAGVSGALSKLLYNATTAILRISDTSNVTNWTLDANTVPTTTATELVAAINEVVASVAALLTGAVYTPSNVTTDRTYDANSTTLDEIADVLGTLIADLQAVGILS